jgi:parallel beta-helix repeat protein
MNIKIKYMLLITAILLAPASDAGAATLKVCPSGCDYSDIQQAINAANSGDTIEVHSGTYSEHVNVDKQLTLLGIGNPVVKAMSYSAITLSEDGITLEGFTATGSDKGINVISNNNVLIGNTASNNKYGIYLVSSCNNLLSSNSADSNERYGIYLVTNSNSNTLKGNTVSNNGYGVRIQNSNNNLVFQNDLANNPNAGSTGGNQWDNGAGTGNHYSDYDESGEGCSDNNKDGICDSPHDILGGSDVDRYPLVSWTQPPTPTTTPTAQEIPEFPTIALPVFSVIVVLFVLNRRK